MGASVSGPKPLQGSSSFPSRGVGTTQGQSQGRGFVIKTGRQSPRVAILIWGRLHVPSVLQKLLLGICYQTKNRVCKILGLSGPGRRIQTHFQTSSGQQNLKSTFSRVLSYTPHPPLPPLNSKSHMELKGKGIRLVPIHSHLNPQTGCFARDRGLPRHLGRLPWTASCFESGNCISPELYVQVQY